MKRARLDVDPGTLARESWTAYGWASQRVPLSPETATLDGRLEGAEVWARLRWGAEHTDGEPGYDCGLYLHVDQQHDGWMGSARVRSRLDVGRHVWAAEGDRREGAVIRGVRLARDARGEGSWAWVLDLITVDRWRSERRNRQLRGALLASR